MTEASRSEEARPHNIQDLEAVNASGDGNDSVKFWSRHNVNFARVSAPPDHVFAFIDDHARLASHMSKSSWQLGGGRMKTTFDEGRGQIVGSRIRVSGRVLGLELSVDEMVTKREPPKWKVWETVGTPRLLVIGSYRMGFEITPDGTESMLRVFIDYALPSSWLGRLLGHLFGGRYATWCTRSMVNDAERHFATSSASTRHKWYE